MCTAASHTHQVSPAQCPAQHVELQQLVDEQPVFYSQDETLVACRKLQKDQTGKCGHGSESQNKETQIHWTR